MAGDFESVLAAVESNADASQKAANQVAKATKRLGAAARIGDAGAIDRAIAESQQALADLQRQVASTRAAWNFDVPAYLESGAFTAEFMDAAKAAGLRPYEQDGRIFSYPLLLRVVAAATAGDCAVVQDKKRIKSLRPSHLAGLLRDARDKPPAFNTRAFLKALYAAYCEKAGEWGSGSDRLARGPVIELAGIYELLTLFPGKSREYSKQEFARDLYILDRSGMSEDTAGPRIIAVELAASTGTKNAPTKLFRLVDEEGSEVVYYSICFTRRPKL